MPDSRLTDEMIEERLAHRGKGGHWLIFDTDKLADDGRMIGPVKGCCCGFTADLDSDCGAGDSVLDHFESVVRAEERAKIADEIEAWWHRQSMMRVSDYTTGRHHGFFAAARIARGSAAATEDSE